MSKAEERAFERCPKSENAIEEMRNERKRAIFTEGYRQAEKDLELTCDDINIIINAFLDYKIESVKSGKDKKYTNEEYCKEVLKRFKDLKHVK